MADPDPSGQVTCPHCGFVQPAAENYLDQGEVPARKDNQPPSPAADGLDKTMADMKMPWADGGGGSSGLEPISFDDLEELEQLLSADAAPLPSIPPKTTPGIPPAEHKPSGAGPRISFGTGDEFDEAEAAAAAGQAEASEAPAEAPGGATIWRLKSTKGLTYSFYNTQSLQRWAEGLGESAGMLVSIDGITWKKYDEFQELLGDTSGAIDAFKGATPTGPPRSASVPGPSQTQTTIRSESRPAMAPAKPKRSVSAARTGSRTRTSTTAERPRMSSTQSAIEAVTAEAMAVEAGRSTTGQRPRPSKGKSSRPAPRTTTGSYQFRAGEGQKSSGTWAGRALFLGFGTIIGGASVYFGLYLLGYYDLVFAF